MIDLSDLSRLSEKMDKVQTLIDNYQDQMAVNQSDYSAEIGAVGESVGERKFTMFEDLWVSSDRRVGR